MNWTINQTVDLSRGYTPVVWPDALMVSGDVGAHTWRLTVLDNGVPAYLHGATITGSFLRADGNTVTVAGTVSGNIAIVTLTDVCYAVEGKMKGTIKMTKSGTVITLAAVIFMVSLFTSGSVIDPGVAYADFEIDASPRGVYADLAALNAGTPTAPDVTKIYITDDDKKWCYHNGAAWVAGGVYQATGIADGAVRITKLSADIQAGLFAYITQNFVIEEGYYSQDNGAFYANPYYTSVTVPCVPFDLFKVSTYVTGESGLPAVIFYDSSFDVVSHSTEYVVDTEVVDLLVEIPAGVAFFTVTNNKLVGTAHGFKKPTVKKLDVSIASPRPMAGKTILTMGDSITYGAMSTNHYQDKIEEITGALTINSGYSGSKYALKADHEPWNANSFYWKTISLGLDGVDYIWIMYGVNDFNNGIPLGTAAGDEYTVCGALYKGLTNLMTRAPTVKIFASTPIFFCTEDGTTLFDPDTEEGFYANAYMRDYITAIKAVYATFRIPVFDAFAECRINIQNHETWLADKLHPNNAGNDLIGEQFANFILQHQ